MKVSSFVCFSSRFYNINDLWNTSYICTSLCVVFILFGDYIYIIIISSISSFDCFFVDISMYVSRLCSIIYQLFLRSFSSSGEIVFVQRYMQTQLCSMCLFFSLGFHILRFLVICAFLINPLKIYLDEN